MVILKDRLRIVLLILSEFKLITQLLFPLKSSENLWLSDDFRGNRSELIGLNSLNISSEIWARSLSSLK